MKWNPDDLFRLAKRANSPASKLARLVSLVMTAFSIFAVFATFLVTRWLRFVNMQEAFLWLSRNTSRELMNDRGLIAKAQTAASATSSTIRGDFRVNGMPDAM